MNAASSLSRGILMTVLVVALLIGGTVACDWSKRPVTRSNGGQGWGRRSSGANGPTMGPGGTVNHPGQGYPGQYRTITIVPRR